MTTALEREVEVKDFIDPPSQFLADPDSGQTSLKVDFSHEQYYFMVVIGPKTYLRGHKSLFERLENKFLLNLGHFPCSLIRVPKTVQIRIPGEPNPCGFGPGITTLLRSHAS